MRSYADKLKENKFKLNYSKIDSTDFKKDYTKKLEKLLKMNKIKEVTSFEIEDKFFETKINNFLKKQNIQWNIIRSPMFLDSREDFKKYLSKTKKPFMAKFYKEKRERFNILLNKDGTPEGGKWSFDEDNRKKLPKNILIPKFPEIKETKHTKSLKPIIEKLFSKHPGDTKKFWFATEYKDVLKLLDFFIKDKLNLFGDYEDAVDQKNNVLFHSALSPYLNLGLITPKEIIVRVLTHIDVDEIPLNSTEGFIRQIIGWREFIRGVYQVKGDQQENSNFFNFSKKLNNTWYSGTTGIPPLDDAINFSNSFGYTHHINRLMIISNLMTLSEIDPKEVYKWFMEMYVDSSDWVMVPNVYGMGTYADGGIFSTKPYICGSNYILKMSNYKKGEWCDVVDGLYWRFVSKHFDNIKNNHRLSFMKRTLEKMNIDRKELIFRKAENFINENTF